MTPGKSKLSLAACLALAAALEGCGPAVTAPPPSAAVSPPPTAPATPAPVAGPSAPREQESAPSPKIRTTADAVRGAAGLSTFRALLDEAKVSLPESGTENLVLVVPDEAFARMPAERIARLRKNPVALARVLSCHVHAAACLQPGALRLVVTERGPGFDLGRVVAYKANDVPKLQDGVVLIAFDLVDPPVAWRN